MPPHYLKVQNSAKALELWNEGHDVASISAQMNFSSRYVKMLLSFKGVDQRLREWVPMVYNPPPLPKPDAKWTCEFCGLFLGEGCIQFYHKSHGLSYAPTLDVVLRIDDRPLLEDIKAHLGGNLYDIPHPSCSGPYKAKPQTEWYVNGWSNCRFVVEATGLNDIVLPAKKAKEIHLLYRMILRRFEMPLKLLDEHREEIHQCALAMKDLKRFSC